MRLVFSTSDFKLYGVSYENFPILLNAEMNIVEEVLLFLVQYCIKRGRVNSIRSWEAYGQTLYDYFSFLEANGLDWRINKYGVNHSILAAYRDWSLSEIKLHPNTVNYRLRYIIKFYQFAFENNWIKSLPYHLEEIRINPSKHFLTHADGRGNFKLSPDILLKKHHSPIKLLNKQQIREFLTALKNPTQKLIARLALCSGLRKEELASFPVTYIFNPQNYITYKSLIRIHLNPTEMKIKGNKPRGIDIPRSLMSDLWQYILHERAQLEKRSGEKQPTLFLNRNGYPWGNSGKSLNNLWKHLNLPFKVTPHMLRHTYATHTLYEMRKRKSQIDPLLYVRERLGHSSILTTEKYLHYINDLEDKLMTDYQEEIDEISSSGIS
ncbi:Tyrosine recombinase XerD [Legionella massiliensis]|uniref:Tyrosine recombinase XerD n=1 Tax=Legionella massiliensis TaxID=1034943 RepID=A0A078L2B3_9GAMM|nr:site-specific integrase [Legionella massiliensis]CDZ79362.1 Tyrosine recombinase XerD [Legionella massiliensis]CEE15100.1 Tyrosine recombinase XerD [Legionella massiliensis]